MIGRKIGIQATGQILLSALLRKNGMPEDKVEKVIVGSDMIAAGDGPGRRHRRLAHQHDGAESARDRTTRRCGCGTAACSSTPCPITRRRHAEVKRRTCSRGFLRAAGRGWAYAKANPEKAVDLLVQEYPNLVRADELAALPDHARASNSTESTESYGWGSFDPAVWQEQIDLYDALKQFPAGKPKLEPS